MVKVNELVAFIQEKWILTFDKDSKYLEQAISKIKDCDRQLNEIEQKISIPGQKGGRSKEWESTYNKPITELMQSYTPQIQRKLKSLQLLKSVVEKSQRIYAKIHLPEASAITSSVFALFTRSQRVNLLDENDIKNLQEAKKILGQSLSEKFVKIFNENKNFELRMRMLGQLNNSFGAFARNFKPGDQND